MLIRSNIFSATSGTKFQLNPTCNFEGNRIQTRDIISKFLVPLLKMVCYDAMMLMSTTVQYSEALLDAMHHVFTISARGENIYR
jgi:hypothetical protein